MMETKQGLKALLQTGLPVRLTAEQTQELWRVVEDHDRLSETAKLAYAFARAKGRHHSQHAACDLLEHFGLPCVRPGEEEVVTCACGDAFPVDSYGAGFMAAHGACENCAAAEAATPEPVAWMYQHDETGQIGFVDQWQIDNGFEKNNPRLHIICPLYRHPPD